IHCEPCTCLKGEAPRTNSYSKGGLKLLKRLQLDHLHKLRMTHPPILFVTHLLLLMLKQVLHLRRLTVEINEEQGKDVDEQVNIKENTDELDQGQAGSDPGRTPKSRPLPEQVVMDEDQAGPDPRESRGDLAGPEPTPMHDEGPNMLNYDSLFSMKNLEDAYAIGDQFINDKYTKDEPKKPNEEAEVVSMVTVLICQTSSSVPPLSTPVPIIDLSHPKPASSTTQAPIFTATATTTTTTLPPPP
nr:hypothetical protein [Tanacetum cinerariifolium]